jgi:hypothetical protein
MGVLAVFLDNLDALVSALPAATRIRNTPTFAIIWRI